MKRIDLSAPSHTVTGKLLEVFASKLNALTKPINKNESAYVARIAHGGSTLVVLYKEHIDIDELVVVTDLTCEHIKNKDLAIAFKDYIINSFNFGSKVQTDFERIESFKKKTA